MTRSIGKKGLCMPSYIQPQSFSILNCRFFVLPHFSCVVGSAMWTFLADKMITTLTRFLAILAIYIAYRILVCSWHGLHTNGLVQERKVIAHVLHASHAKRTGVVLATTVFCITRQMHDMTTSKTLQRFGRIEK